MLAAAPPAPAPPVLWARSPWLAMRCKPTCRRLAPHSKSVLKPERVKAKPPSRRGQSRGLDPATTCARPRPRTAKQPAAKEGSARRFLARARPAEPASGGLGIYTGGDVGAHGLQVLECTGTSGPGYDRGRWGALLPQRQQCHTSDHPEPLQQLSANRFKASLASSAARRPTSKWPGTRRRSSRNTTKLERSTSNGCGARMRFSPSAQRVPRARVRTCPGTLAKKRRS